MPTRGHMSPAQIKQKLGSAAEKLYFSGGSPCGDNQYISALNNVGMFVPGILRMNPVVIQKRYSVSSPGSLPANCKWYGTPISASGDFAAFVAGSMNLDGVADGHSSWDASMASYSLAKALSKASEPDFDVGMILVEIEETIHGLSHPFDALRRYIRSFNKMRSKGPRVSLEDTLGMLSGSWLEWRYGITPIIIAIESAIKLVREQSFTLDGKLLRKRGKVVREYTGTPLTASCGPGYLSFSGTTLRVEIEKKTVSSFYSILRSPITWQERFGLDVLNFPALAWERVPLSFVVDWFFGVAQWLQSLHFSDKRESVGSCTSQKTKVCIKLPSINLWVGSDLVPVDTSYVYTSEMLERRVNQTPPPFPVVNPASLSLQRRLDAITLIWQRLPKLRR